MKGVFLTIFCIIFSFCSASIGKIEPLFRTNNLLDELKLAVNKMRELLAEAPESHAQEKLQAFISLGELENDIQNLSKLFRSGKRPLLIQSSSNTNTAASDEEDEDDSKGSGESKEDTPTPKDLENYRRDITCPHWHFVSLVSIS
ncbi:hypothetical protein HWI79_2930 [Cryptosporidium felis]|nr:hypothetical protein HWI79_2930 [Cryptosporidium felis]